MILTELMDEVRLGLRQGSIAASPNVPSTTVVRLDAPHDDQVLRFTSRPTVGIWAGFSERNPNQATYYFSSNGEFAVVVQRPRIALRLLNVREVIRREEMWSRGLRALLDPASKPRGMNLDPG